MRRQLNHEQLWEGHTQHQAPGTRPRSKLPPGPQLRIDTHTTSRTRWSIHSPYTKTRATAFTGSQPTACWTCATRQDANITRANFTSPPRNHSRADKEPPPSTAPCLLCYHWPSTMPATRKPGWGQPTQRNQHREKERSYSKPRTLAITWPYQPPAGEPLAPHSEEGWPVGTNRASLEPTCE